MTQPPLFPSSSRLPHLSLRDFALAASTRRSYSSHLKSFLTHSRLTKQQFFTLPSSSIDRLLSIFIQHLHDSSSNLTYAACALNASVFVRPGLKLKLPFSRQCLRGWQRLATTQSHTPITWEINALFAVTAAKSGYHAAAVAFLLAFHCYLRVSELTQLQRQHVILPGDSRVGSSSEVMAIVLKRTKTGINQSVTIHHDQVIQAIKEWMLFTHNNNTLAIDTDLVFPFTPTQLRNLMSSISTSLGFTSSPYVPHSLRHGGATHDHLRGHSIEQIMYRGRWKATESARRYIQSGRALLIQSQIPRHLDEMGSNAAKHIAVVLKVLRQIVPDALTARAARRVTFNTTVTSDSL